MSKLDFFIDLSFASDDEKILFLKRCPMDGCFLQINEDNGTPDGKELTRAYLDNSDIDRLIQMLKMVRGFEDEKK